MEIPVIEQTQTPTAQVGLSQSLPGEKVSPKKIPKTEIARWDAIKGVADTVLDISLKVEEAAANEEYQRKLLELKDGYAKLDTDIVQNPIYKKMTDAEIEEAHSLRSKDLQASVLESTKHHLAKKSLTKEAKNMSIASRIKAKTFSYNNTIDKTRATTIEALKTYSTSFSQDGNLADLGRAEAAITAAVTTGAFSREEGVKLLQGFNNTTIASYYDNLLKQDALGLYNQVIVQEKEPASWKGLTPNVREQLKADIKTAYNKQITEAKIGVVGGWQNKALDAPIKTWKQFKAIPRKHFSELDNKEYASLKGQLKRAYEAQVGSNSSASIDPVMSGRLERALSDAIEQVETLGVQPAGIKDAIMTVYGNNTKTKAKGQARYEAYKAESDLAFGKYAIKQDIKNGSVKENSEYLEVIKPKEGERDFKTRQTVYEAAEKEFNQKVEKLSEDPKTLFDSYYPQKRPTSVDPIQRIKENQRYMIELTDWYKKQGLPENMWRVMTKEEAQVYADSIPQKAPNEIIKDIKTIEKNYGVMSKYAFRDLSKEGFPTELRLISDLKDTQLSTVGVDLANAYKLKEVDFAKAMGVEAADKRASVNERINTNTTMKEFEASVYSTGTTSGNINLLADLKNAVRKLSYIHIMRGETDKDAVNKAVKDIIGDKFKYVEINDLTVRIPYEYDDKTTRKTLKGYIKSIEVDDLSQRYIKPEWSGVEKERNEKNIMSNLYNDAAWKNVGGSQNILILVDKAGLPIFNKDEKPFYIDLDKLK